MSETDHGPHLPKPAPLDEPPAAPESIPPMVPTESPPPPVDLAHNDVMCKHCGFNLRGLNPEGNCPECGAPIRHSLGGDLLKYSSDSYLAKLHHGVVIIILMTVLGLLWSLVLSTISMYITFSSGLTGPQQAGNTAAMFSITGDPVYDFMIQLVMLPVSLLSLYGWWLFSSPDPGQKYGDRGQTPRRIIRATVTIAAAATVLSITGHAIMMANQNAWIIAAGTGALLGVVGIVQYFAAMFYVKWLAPRIPHKGIESRAGTYIWLLPVIYLVGSCLIVGPIVAAVMYVLLFNEVRIALKTIRRERESAHQAHGAPDDPPTFCV